VPAPEWLDPLKHHRDTLSSSSWARKPPTGSRTAFTLPRSKDALAATVPLLAGVIGNFHELSKALQRRYLALGVVGDFV